MKKKVIISLAGVAVILLSVLILFLYFQGKTAIHKNRKIVGRSDSNNAWSWRSHFR